MAAIPADAESTYALTHDSCYLAIVADNVAAGKGFINEAHWLVFLNPDRLPMPYHNGKPLYVLLMALGPWLLGVSAEYAGLVFSALSTPLLMLGLFMMPWRGVSTAEKLVLAAFGAHFPSVLQSSLVIGTDALSTSFFFCFVAAAFSVDRKRSELVAGVLLGLAWLIRSQIILVLPAVLIYFFLKLPAKQAARRLLVILVLGAAVSAPWLWRTKSTFGSFLYSDDSYYLVQDIEGRRLEGELSSPSMSGSHPAGFATTVLEHFLHSTERPPGPLAIVERDPMGFLRHVAVNIPWVSRQLLVHWTEKKYWVLAVLAASAALGCLVRRRLYTAEAIAAIVYTATFMPVFAIRGDSFEVRYFGTIGVLAGLLVGAGLLETVRWVRSRVWRREVRLAAVAASCILIAGAIARVAWPAIQETYKRFDERLELEAIAREANAKFTKGGPVVVGTKPYYYTRVTGASALSIPWSNDDYLKGYMKKYGASYVLLSEQEKAFWRPGWESPPPFLELEARIGSAYLYRRVTRHD